MTSEPRRLLLLRHAKAEGHGETDHARALTESGRRSASEVGLWLAGQGIVPDHAFVSSAVRTRQTWDAVSAASRATVEASVEDPLYSAGPDTALEVLTTAPEEVRTLLYVGHNPTVALLAHSLIGGDPDATAFRALSKGYPPAALAVLEIPVGWADLADGVGRLADFHVGAP